METGPVATAVVEELNFLGVKLARTISKSRALNGEELTSRVKSKIASWAGRHSPWCAGRTC